MEDIPVANSCSHEPINSAFAAAIMVTGSGGSASFRVWIRGYWVGVGQVIDIHLFTKDEYVPEPAVLQTGAISTDSSAYSTRVRMAALSPP